MLHVILFVTPVINHGLDQKTKILRNVINDYQRAERASRDSFCFYIKNLIVFDNNDGNDYILIYSTCIFTGNTRCIALIRRTAI